MEHARHHYYSLKNLVSKLAHHTSNPLHSCDLGGHFSICNFNYNEAAEKGQISHQIFLAGH